MSCINESQVNGNINNKLLYGIFYLKPRLAGEEHWMIHLKAKLPNSSKHTKTSEPCTAHEFINSHKSMDWIASSINELQSGFRKKIIIIIIHIYVYIQTYFLMSVFTFWRLVASKMPDGWSTLIHLMRCGWKYVMVKRQGHESEFMA